MPSKGKARKPKSSGDEFKRRSEASKKGWKTRIINQSKAKGTYTRQYEKPSYDYQRIKSSLEFRETPKDDIPYGEDIVADNFLELFCEQVEYEIKHSHWKNTDEVRSLGRELLNAIDDGIFTYGEKEVKQKLYTMKSELADYADLLITTSDMPLDRMAGVNGKVMAMLGQLLSYNDSETREILQMDFDTLAEQTEEFNYEFPDDMEDE